MSKNEKKNENYDALDTWREETRVYAGGSEYDPTFETILAYERAKKSKEIQEQEMDK